MKKNFICCLSLTTLLSSLLFSCSNTSEIKDATSNENISNSTEGENTDSKSLSLKDFKVTFAAQHSENEEYIAQELSEAFINSGVNIPYSQYSQFNPNLKQINLSVDKSTGNYYKISYNNGVFSIVSNSNEGLIEGCSCFYQKAKENNYVNVENWFKETYQQTYSTSEKLNIMSYNVRAHNDGTLYNGDSGNVSNRLPRVIKCIEHHDPDTIGVQEVSDAWITNLKTGMPKYGYIGWGRESNYFGERSGIFYNRDKLTLLDGGTRWLSDKTNTPGSKFSGSEYCRIFTYGIFVRHSDNFLFMHINTHFDLEADLRVKDTDVLTKFAEGYRKLMPIIVTGDLNDDGLSENDAVRTFINKYGYINASSMVKNAAKLYTFPQLGYNAGKPSKVIDYGLVPNFGLSFTDYIVDTDKYSGDGVEKPQLTSDHYPLVFKARPYNPLTPYNDFDYGNKNVEVDNSYCTYDSEFTFKSTKSTYKNHLTLLAKDSNHNGNIYGTNKSHTKYETVGGIDSSGKYLEYSFNSNENTKGDIVLAVSSNYKGSTQVPNYNYIMENLGTFTSLKVNSNNIDLTDITLPNYDVEEFFHWVLLKLKDVDIKAGTNTVKFENIRRSPNMLLMEVFSDSTLSS